MKTRFALLVALPLVQSTTAFWLGEARGEDVRAAVAEHVPACDVCHASLEALERVLTLVEAVPAPERDASYGRLVWQKLAQQAKP